MLAFLGLSGYEILIVVAIFLLLFGSTRLPSLMRSMGRSVNEFKAGLTDRPAPVDESDDVDSADDSKTAETKNIESKEAGTGSPS